MKKLATYLAGGLALASAVAVINCSSNDSRPDAGDVDVRSDSGTADTGLTVVDASPIAKGVSVNPSLLAFGLVNCGTKADFKTVTIESSVAGTFTAALGKGAGSAFTLADANGTAIALGVPQPIVAFKELILRVVPKDVTAPVATTENGLGDKLTITTDVVGDQPHVIELTETAQGAYIALDKANYKITDAAVSHSLFTEIKITNTGNLPGNYTITSPARLGFPTDTFSLNGSAGALAAGTGQQSLTLTTKTDAAWQCTVLPKPQYLGDIKMTVTAVALCSDPQPTAPLSLECP